jgi:hypothetical protein
MRFEGCSSMLRAKDLDEMGCEEVAKYSIFLENVGNFFGSQVSEIHYGDYPN